MPGSLADLGLPQEELERHIAWDIGAAELARGLAERLGVAALLSGYSRLVIDCNRHPDDPGSILARSDGTVVPGNAELDPRQREARVREIFDPYHAAIERELGYRSTPLPQLLADTIAWLRAEGLMPVQSSDSAP